MAISDLFFLNENGVVFPDYPTVLEQLKQEYRTIYGEDTYLEADSQDGQWVAVMALAMFDTMQVAAAVYNSFSPMTAQSDALTRNVKINGIRRLSPSFSTVDLRIVGQAGSIITNGQAEDTIGNKWRLPASVTIPVAGEITVTATAVEIGAVSAAAGTITKIATPTVGWQSVTNNAAASEGDPVETDAELRRRQTESTMIPSQTVMEGIIGAVSSLPSVARYRGYENDSDETDADGITAHSISLVVEGGDATDIAEAIANKKPPGTGTYGTTSVTVYDRYGVGNDIKFFRPTVATISVEVTLTDRVGYLSTTADLIKVAVAQYLEGLEIGDDVYITKLYVPANLLNNPTVANTFDVTNVRIKKNAGSFGTSNIALAFNEIAVCDSATNVTVIVT
jgi:uncharacterized phage protein gp47/JayE